MAYLSTDLRIKTPFVDTVDRAVYTGDSHDYVKDSFYVLYVGSTDGVSPAAPLSVVTTGVVWTLVHTQTRTDITLSMYTATPAANTTSTTVVSYNSLQERCTMHLIEVDLPSELVQYNGDYGLASDITVTLPAEPITGSLILSGFFAGGARLWTPGTGQTGLTTGTVYSFSQYNLGTSETLSATINSDIYKVGIGIEIVETGAGAPPEATAVITKHTLELIDKSTTVLATALVNGEEYEIVLQGTSDFTLVGAADNNPGTRFTASGPTAGDGTALHVIPCICESTDFAGGVAAILNIGEIDEEFATLVTAIDTASTATPQYNCTFTKAPVNGVDTISFLYSSTTGDIKSVTGGIALAAGLFNSTAGMVC